MHGTDDLVSASADWRAQYKSDPTKLFDGGKAVYCDMNKGSYDVTLA